MSAVKKSLLAAVAAVGLAAGFSSSANATLLFDFNPGAGNTSGAATATNVKILDIGGGTSTILQNTLNGSPLGQTFTETGTLNLTNYTNSANQPVVFLSGSSLPGTSGLGTGTSLTFSFNVSGSVDNFGNLHFNGGNDAVTLFLNTSGSPITLAKFNVLPGTGGTGITSLGALPTAAVSLLLVEDVANSTPGLFTINGQDIGPIAFDLTNVQPTLDTTVSNNPSSVPSTGPGLQTIVVTDTGNVQLQVPEPGTLALIGSGLLGLAFVRRRKSSAV